MRQQSSVSLPDAHTHILPGMDDGSDSTATSLAMLRQCAAQGVETVAATPHYYADTETPGRFLERRRVSLDTLTAAMADESDLPPLIPGAEVLYFPGMSRVEELREMQLGSSGCLLVEPPMAPWSERMLEELCALPQRLGLRPIIAHLDRYMLLLHDRRLPRRLEGTELLVQVNASFFLNPFTVRRALGMLEDGQIDLLGSDCHNMEKRAPNLGAAAAKIEERLGSRKMEAFRQRSRELLGLRTEKQIARKYMEKNFGEELL